MTIDPQDKLRLNHIIEATGHIGDFIKGVTDEEFGADYEKQSAVVRQLEVIGEAAGKLSAEFIGSHTEIDWPKVVGMRHKMIHDYFEVDVKIVWATANDDAPTLKKEVEKILSGV